MKIRTFSNTFDYFPGPFHLKPFHSITLAIAHESAMQLTAIVILDIAFHASILKDQFYLDWRKISAVIKLEKLDLVFILR